MDEANFIDTLFAIIEDRKANPKPDSYTTSLFEMGEDEIVKKVGEEAIEVILAAKGQGNECVVEETADLIYHLLVMLAYRDLTWDDIRAELVLRHG